MGWYEEVKQLIRENREMEPNLEKALVQYLTVEMQTDLNNAFRNQGEDEMTYMDEEGGIRFIYLKPFTLTLGESGQGSPITIDAIVEQFDNRLTREQVEATVTKYNELSPQMQKDERGRLKGFYLDLIAVAPEWYQGEKFYVDVFTDMSGEGEITFGIDEPAEIYQVAIED